MPKLKNNSSAAKRFRKTGGGKIKRGRAFRRHLLSCKPRKNKRKLRAVAYVDRSNERQIRQLLPS